MSLISIYGASVGGMSAAARLAVKGHDVHIYEHSNAAGSELLDLPNRITLPAALRDLFLKTGAPLEDSVTLVESEIAYDALLSNGSIFQMPGFGVTSTTRAIAAALGDHAARQWSDHIKQAARTWEGLHKHVENYPEYMAALQRAAKSSWLTKRKQTLRNPDLIAIRNASPFYTTSPVLVNLMPYIAATFGVYEVAGGLTNIATALQQRCESLGVVFHFSETAMSHAHDGNIVVIASTQPAGKELLNKYAQSSQHGVVSMQTNSPNVFIVGAQTYPGTDLAFAVLSGSMLANLIGSAHSNDAS